MRATTSVLACLLLAGQAGVPALRELSGHGDNVYSLAFSPDGQLLASASGDGTARLWDLATGKVRHVLARHNGSCYQAVFAPDGKTDWHSRF